MHAQKTLDSFGENRFGPSFGITALSGLVAPAAEAATDAVWRSGWWLLRSARRATAALRALRARRRVVATLAALDDHLLDDIGLSRGDLGSIASGRLTMADFEARRFDASAGVRRGHARTPAAGIRLAA